MKSRSKIFILLPLALCIVHLQAGTIDIHGVDVDENSLTAKYLPSVLEKALSDIQGSYLAYAQARIIQLKQERDNLFPEGDPVEKMNVHVSALPASLKVERQSEWDDLLTKKASFASYQKRIDKFNKIHENMLNLPKSLVELALEVEQSPSSLDVCQEGALPSHTQRYQGSNWPLSGSDYIRANHLSGVSFLRKQAYIYSCEDLVSNAEPEICLGALFKGMKAEKVDEVITSFRRDKLSPDKFYNASFVTRHLTFPLLECLRKIQREALRAQKSDGVETARGRTES